MNEAAYAACMRMAASHYENFPVASRLMPPAARPHIAAIYAFARTADDFADEGERADAERLAALDDWLVRLRAAADGRIDRDGSEAELIFTALAETIRTLDLGIQHFEDLLSAFRQDVLVKRYETWDDLIDYCRRSAAPVGRLVLRVCGYRDAQLDSHSDAICNALQLTNFWQDVGVDWAKGRIYLPTSLRAAAGASEGDLAAGCWTAGWEDAMREAAARTRQLFVAGRPLPDAVGGRLRYELRATWLGGVRILGKLDSRRYDALHHRPTLGWYDALSILGGVVSWRARSGHAVAETR